MLVKPTRQISTAHGLFQLCCLDPGVRNMLIGYRFSTTLCTSINDEGRTNSACDKWVKGDTRIHYAMKLVPPKDLGSTIQSTLVIGNTIHSITIHWSTSICIFFLVPLYKHLRTHTNFPHCVWRMCMYLWINITLIINTPILTNFESWHL